MLILPLLVIAIVPVQPSLASLGRPTSTKVQAATVMIHLNGFVNAWNSSTNPNPTITVKQGDMVTVSVVSSDSAPHQFLLDMDKDGSTTATCMTIDPCSLQVPPSTSFSFVAGASGSYTYYCTIHPTMMLAPFVILAVASGGGGGHVFEK
jgi:plastocyanin